MATALTDSWATATLIKKVANYLQILPSVDNLFLIIINSW